MLKDSLYIWIPGEFYATDCTRSTIRRQLKRHRNDDDSEEILQTPPGMPFKSQAQRRKFAELLVEGKISNDTFEEWNRETGGRKLPERVGRKSAPRRRTVKRRAAKRRR